MMSLEKTCFELTAYMQDNIEYADFWKILHEEYKLSVAYILKISGYKELMEEEPVSRISIDIREEIVLPLLTLQQYALQKIANNDKDITILEKIVSRTMYGNINASRNSA
jgi:phosphoenolpyruvate carboxylase